MLERCINYDGVGAMKEPEPVTGKTPLPKDIAYKAMTGEILVTSDGSADYAPPLNNLHREGLALTDREYSHGFGY